MAVSVYSPDTQLLSQARICQIRWNGQDKPGTCAGLGPDGREPDTLPGPATRTGRRQGTAGEQPPQKATVATFNVWIHPLRSKDSIGGTQDKDTKRTLPQTLLTSRVSRNWLLRSIPGKRQGWRRQSPPPASAAASSWGGEGASSDDLL